MISRPVLAVGVGCACLLSLSGCGKKVVPQSTVETQVATQVAAEVHQPKPNVSCPGDLDAKVGATMTCVLTPQNSTTSFNVTVKVNSISNGTAHFGISVASTPNPTPSASSS
jgi:hypothetical protein